MLDEADTGRVAFDAGLFAVDDGLMVPGVFDGGVALPPDHGVFVGPFDAGVVAPDAGVPFDDEDGE